MPARAGAACIAAQFALWSARQAGIAERRLSKPGFERWLMSDTAHDFQFAGIDGGALPLSAWKGQPVLVVNTASYCGYTPQYRDLEALWQHYRDRGLVVLGVPSNDFGAQEPGSAAEIKSFCETRFQIDFPL